MDLSKSSNLSCSSASQVTWDDGGDTTMPYSVDTVHFEINEPRFDPSTKWYSHKSNGPGLSYEIALMVYKQQVVHRKGPEPAATSDVAIFTAPGGLKEKIPEGKKAIGDRLYKDEKCSIRNDRDPKEVKIFKRRVRARHENFNGRLKNFKILSTKFRHDIKKHQVVFDAVCVICQYDMENGNPLFDV